MRENTSQLYKGDCLEVMKALPDNSMDLILCDLPYGTSACLQTAYGNVHCVN